MASALSMAAIVVITRLIRQMRWLSLVRTARTSRVGITVAGSRIAFPPVVNANALGSLPGSNDSRHIHDRFNPNHCPSMRSVKHQAIPNVQANMPVLLETCWFVRGIH